MQAAASRPEFFVCGLATSLVGSGYDWGPNTDRNRAYLYDVNNGATTLTVPTLHALDAFEFMLGNFLSVSVTLAVRRTKVRLIDEGKDIPVSAPDQIAIVYAQFAKDIRERTDIVPDFAHAASRHRLLDAIENASQTGVSLNLDGKDVS